VALTCHIHPSSSAEDRCEVCRLPLCPVCVVTRGTTTMCRICAAGSARERRRQLVRMLLALSFLLAGVLTAHLLLRG
jgi:hypothetical protein